MAKSNKALFDFGDDFEENGVHNIDTDEVEVEYEEEEEFVSMSNEKEDAHGEKDSTELKTDEEEENFLSDCTIPKRKKHEKKESAEKLKSSGKGRFWKRFLIVGVLVVLFVVLVTGVYLYSGNSGNKKVMSMDVLYEDHGFDVSVFSSEDRVFNIEAVLFGGSNWPIGCGFDNSNNWPVKSFGQNSYSFRSQDIDISAGERKHILVSFNTLDVWHCEFTLHEMVGSEKKDVLVNIV